MNTEEKTIIEGVRYSGKKWFLKFAYQVTETDVAFTDTGLTLNQGSAFAVVKNKTKSEIDYNKITSVTSSTKFSTPNIVTAALIAVLAVASGVLAILAISALFIFLGKTAIVTINYSGGAYEIPVEFKSDADELVSKIETAKTKSKM